MCITETHAWTPGVKSIFCTPGRSHQRACWSLTPEPATPVPLPFLLALDLISYQANTQHLSAPPTTIIESKEASPFDPVIRRIAAFWE
jgi:hypothetical protein